MKLKLRKMKPEDLEQVMVIEKQNFPDPFPEEIFTTLMSSPQHWCHVGYTNDDPDKVLCYTLLQVNHGESHLMKLSVITQKQVQSIGTQMVKLILDMSDGNEKFNVMWLQVRESNTPALKLYEKLGFQVHIKREGYYQHEDSKGNIVIEDAIMMVKRL